MAGLREKIKGELEKVTGSGVYEGLTAAQILKRMVFGGGGDPEILTPLESWMRRYGFTKEEVLEKFPGKFNRDGSFKEMK